MSEQIAFLKWLDSEKEKGLIDLKIYPVSTETATKEAYYAELNDINRAIETKRFTKILDL